MLASIGKNCSSCTRVIFPNDAVLSDIFTGIPSNLPNILCEDCYFYLKTAYAPCIVCGRYPFVPIDEFVFSKAWDYVYPSFASHILSKYIGWIHPIILEENLPTADTTSSKLWLCDECLPNYKHPHGAHITLFKPVANREHLLVRQSPVAPVDYYSSMTNLFSSRLYALYFYYLSNISVVNLTEKRVNALISNRDYSIVSDLSRSIPFFDISHLDPKSLKRYYNMIAKNQYVWQQLPDEETWDYISFLVAMSHVVNAPNWVNLVNSPTYRTTMFSRILSQSAKYVKSKQPNNPNSTYATFLDLSKKNRWVERIKVYSKEYTIDNSIPTPMEMLAQLVSDVGGISQGGENNQYVTDVLNDTIVDANVEEGERVSLIRALTALSNTIVNSEDVLNKMTPRDFRAITSAINQVLNQSRAEQTTKLKANGGDNRSMSIKFHWSDEGDNGGHSE